MRWEKRPTRGEQSKLPASHESGWRATAGVMVKHAWRNPCKLKSVFEVSERRATPPFRWGQCSQSPEVTSKTTGCARNGHAARLDPNGRAVRAARDTTDHLQHQGFLLRTWEPRSDRQEAIPAELPDPAMPRTGGGAPVAVATLESPAPGEGRQ